MRDFWNHLLWAPDEDQGRIIETVSEHRPEEVRTEGRILDQQIGERPSGGGGGHARERKPEPGESMGEPTGEQERAE